MIYNDHPYYFRKNLQGDVIAITEWSGETVARYTYDAWGKCTIVDLARAHEIATINLTVVPASISASAPTGADIFISFFKPGQSLSGLSVRLFLQPKQERNDIYGRN